MDILSLCKGGPAADAILAHRRRIAALIDQGVILPCPEAVEIGEDVRPERIAPGVVLHAGSRVRGARTLLSPGVVVGREGPASVEDTVCGPGAQLDGGTFSGATLLDGAGARSWAHIRPGCLLEEHASVAHCVGIKQSILFPWVTLGSLINFCDVLMAGGTSGHDHSEVGSGYIHFNFTPRGDKATPSLYGDVPRGVLLDRPRIFLGGLAATVGPMHVGFGSFLGPGEVFRRDVREGRFTLGERKPQLNIEYEPRLLTGLRGKVRKNLTFIGNLVALRRWYVDARPLLTGGDPWRALAYEGGRETVEACIAERVKQLGKLMELLPESIALLEAGSSSAQATEQRQLLAGWPRLKAALEDHRGIGADGAERSRALEALSAGRGSYTDVVQGLDEAARADVSAWLGSVVDGVVEAGRAAMDAPAP